ncbi:MAG: polysaccharide export protein [Candidatus Omnitrophica bacterium]|nr:polysaccharide export protein [Candidatus Omnitrophota bacterium]
MRLSFLSVSFILFLAAGSLLYSQDLEQKARQHYRVGTIYYEHGLYKEAEREFKRSLQFLKDKERLSRVARVEEPLGLEEAQPVTAADAQSGAYIIGQGDTLFISVWENPDLDQETIVRPDGKISLPLVDEVQASGLSVGQLDEKITAKLKEYIRFPDVSISLRKIGLGKVIVLGEVVYPGVYSISGATNLLEVIALAGGFTSHSVASSVIVVKDGFDNPKAERFDLNKAIHKPSSQQNITLASGNIVFVPKKFIADVNYFLSTLFGPILDNATKAQGFSRGAKVW